VTIGNDAKIGGMRQLILFSDGEEESIFTTADASMLIRKARSEGVQVHFLFINQDWKKKPEAIAKIKRFQSISDKTGGIHIIKNVVTGQGALDRGAQKIANKIGKLRRVMLSICEVQQTGHHTLKIQYDASDYAWVEHHIKSDLPLKQNCPCVPACLGGESCSDGKCSSTDNIEHEVTNFDYNNYLNSFREQYTDPWWLLLTPLWPLLLLLLFWKKKQSKDLVETLDQIPAPEGDDELH
jgi:hypothetical protein